jgi:hypothetical protein
VRAVAFILEAGVGFLIGYLAGSLLESILHEYVSDAPARFMRFWHRHPRLFRVMINSQFSHHVIHHYKTFRRDHVTQFETAQERELLEAQLLARGRHGRIIIDGNFANRVHAEGAFVFALPAILVGAALALVAPVAVAIGAAIGLSLPPLFSYFLHPYFHMRFEDGQKVAPPAIRLLLRTRYMRAIYRNHFMHHRHGGTSNYNLVLGPTSCAPARASPAAPTSRRCAKWGCRWISARSGEV